MVAPVVSLLRNNRVRDVLASIKSLPEAERAELKAQLTRCSWWVSASSANGSGPLSDFLIVFDGGSRGNPGQGYGSFLITRLGDGTERRKRLDLGSGVTNNEAEYDTLLAALEELRHWASALGLDPRQISVELRGDSQLVLRQIDGRWKARDPRMADRRDHALELLRRFGGFRLVEQPREESVRIVGH